MGISTSTAALLCRARQRGARFDRTVTIGRMSLHVPLKDVDRLARSVGIVGLDGSRFTGDGFADDFIRLVLGASSVTAVDVVAYQGAQIVHDLNRPIDPSLHHAFDTVIDGGTLEHVFDVKQALANYMNLVKCGGDVFIITPANNLYGHGFYQFGAELFCRVFDASNGFAVQDLVLVESPFVSVSVSRRQHLFQIDDPAMSGKRVHLVNEKPTLLFVHARRVSDEPPFRTPPFQSDYAAKWHGRPPHEIGSTGFSYLTGWQELRRTWKQRRSKSLRNRRAFRRLEL
jgi:hypothetical protein